VHCTARNKPGFTSVTVNDQLPDYDDVMNEPSTVPSRTFPTQLIIRSITQADGSLPPGYVAPDDIFGNNAIPLFTLPLPPTYEEAISSQSNSGTKSFSEIPLT
jgi:hypothetical protein